jgi:sugar phosphate isomerase/epimerase
MRIGKAHLSYCSNIHPGESWAEVRDNLERYVPAVKAKLACDDAFGIGLRLSADAADTLVSSERALADLEGFLADHDLYVFTLNGFPYGPFHGQPVKEKVYQPDWLDPERVRYSDTLAHVLAKLLPDGVDGSISTVPGAFRANATSADERALIADNITRHAHTLAKIFDDSGKKITLALEPEPRCMLETTAEAVAFFEEHLADEGTRRHVGVCLDTCHAAVEFEQPKESIALLHGAGIEIAKIQLSAGLRITDVDESKLRALAAFDEPVYLHQVVERRDGELLRYLDIADAVAAFHGPGNAQSVDSGPTAPEWRVHFHVPIFLERLGHFEGTQAYVAELLEMAREQQLSPHLEVETYTWDVLPEEHRAGDVVSAIARELSWVMDRLS